MLQFVTISIFLFFISFKSIGQDFAKAKELFIEISPLFLKVEDLKSTNIDSAKGLNKQLIKNLELIYQTDSSFKHISDYLGDCYTYENDDRKAIYWYSKQLPEYSHQEFPIACYSCIALSYCRLGELDSCKQYTLRANISFDKNYLGGTRDYLLRLKKIADNIYSGFDKKTIEILKIKAISPCKYSIDILTFLLPFFKEKNEFGPVLSFNQDTILLRQKCCK